MGLAFNLWQNVWCGEANLKPLFSELYSIARDKEAIVLDYMDIVGTYVH
jgi:hypothetical protein